MAEIVDRNANLEEDYQKVSAFKPLMDSYKSQITELESKASARAQENDALKFDLEQTRTKLKIASDERAKDSEAIELYQERVRELELSRPAKAHRPGKDAHTKGEYLDEDNVEQGLSDELDGAISGTTMTDLRLQNRKLKRELESLRSNMVDSSQTMVLENMLEDAKRMKARYEADYLAAHREKLVLQRDLDEIRNGKFVGDR
jgi:protein HOOK3